MWPPQAHGERPALARAGHWQPPRRHGVGVGVGIASLGSPAELHEAGYARRVGLDLEVEAPARPARPWQPGHPAPQPQLDALERTGELVTQADLGPPRCPGHACGERGEGGEGDTKPASGRLNPEEALRQGQPQAHRRAHP